MNTPTAPLTTGNKTMKSQPLIAMQAAELAHSGYYRRDRKTPYITHPAAVARRLSNKGADDTTIAAAWLHDVLEDTNMTAAMLTAHGVSAEVLEVVSILTRKDEDSYEHYLARVKANPRARVIKVADMLHNLSDDPTERQAIKYAEGLLILLG